MEFNGTGFICDADNITLDLNGHSIIGRFISSSGPNFPAEFGISANGHSGITIKNGTITGFVFGIYLFSCDHCIVKDIISTSNNLNGIMLLGSSNNTVKGCTTADNGAFGIAMNIGSDNNEVKGCVSNNNELMGIYIGGNPATSPSNGNTIKDTTTGSNQVFGVLIENSTFNVVINCTSVNNMVFGIMIRNSHYISLLGNKVEGNLASGILLAPGTDDNLVQDNSIWGNSVDGLIVGGNNNQIINNKFKGNLSFDILDNTHGTGTAGTANFYAKNKGTSSQPSGLVK